MLNLIKVSSYFDDLYMRGNLSRHEQQNFLQKVLSFEGYPEYGINLSSAFDNYITSNLFISPEEEDMIENYVANSWEYINKHLVGKEISPEIQHAERKRSLTEVINKMPLSPLDFYRASRTSGRAFFNPLINKLEKGIIEKDTILLNKSFLSFTTSPYALKAFAGDELQGKIEKDCVIYKVAGNVNAISKVSSVEEFEGIIPPDSLLRVKSANNLLIETKSGQQNNIWFVELERVSDTFVPHLDFYGNPI